MHTCIIIQFRMKRSCKLAALSCGHNFSIYYGKYLCLSVDIVNIRCTDECHWNLSNFFHLIFCIKASKLSSIRIPLCQNIHRTKTWNSVFHPLCQKDQSGAGSEYRKPVFNLLFQCIVNVQFDQKLSHNGTFSTRKDQTIKVTVQIFFFPDFKMFHAQAVQHLSML